MENQDWDGAAYRTRMGVRADDHQRYIDQHKDRLRTGQSNGSRSTHDRWLGEWWVYYRLAGIAATEKPETLIAELRDLAANVPNISGAFDQETAKSGFLMAIRGELAELGEELPRI